MIDIQGHIVDHWLGKMDENHPVLTIYDATGQYYELLSLVEERGVMVVDTTKDILLTRMKSCEFWMTKLQQNSDARLVIYRKTAPLVNNTQKVADPYAALAQINNKNFPQEGAKDMYINMCKSFIHGKADVIDDLFRDGCPSFNTINALLDGANYPELESITKGKSMVEITVNLLALDEVKSSSWLSEWRSFGAAHFPNLDCNGFTLREIQGKLWQYLLYSEFALDLPIAIPAELVTVPVSPKEKFDTITNVCRAIRNRVDLRNDYVEQAQNVVSKLRLDEIFSGANDLGKIVTFAFENRVEYENYVAALHSGDYTKASERFFANKHQSLWFEADKDVSTFWNLAEQCELMLKSIRDAKDNLDSLANIANWYVENGYRVDSAFRHYQTLLSQSSSDILQTEEMTQVVHSNYRAFTEHIQKTYQEKFAEEGYGAMSIASNLGFWNEYVKPLLDKKKKVVVLMADAFRYEMGKELEQSIVNHYDEVECIPSRAYVPTVTRFGMAALLPDAENKMMLSIVDGHLQPVFDGEAIKIPDDRIAYIEKSTPSTVKVQDFNIKDFVPSKISSDTNLLIIRSVDIDASGENLTGNGLSSMETELRSFATKIRQCKNEGFDYLFVVADHGFMMQPSWISGDTVEKPKGTVKFEKCRCLGGDLNSNASSLILTPDKLCVKTELYQFAFAKQFGVYESGKIYFHEGLSLQENIVPILKVMLKKSQNTDTFDLKLTYKSKDSGVIHIYCPKIEITLESNNLFTPEAVFRLRITNETGVEVGHTMASIYYDDMTDVITIPEGTPAIRQSIMIEEGTTGNIIIQALHPDTNMTLATLTLQTEFND